MNNILIVEDEEKIARFIELELTHEGYETTKSYDGREGLELALSGDFDLVILDIMLPSLSGIEVLRRLRRTSDIPVILLTARDSVTDKVSGLDTGANDYITKPFAIEELLARIRVILRNAHAEHDHRTAEVHPDRLDRLDRLDPHGRLDSADTGDGEGEIYTCGDITLSTSSYEVTYKGEPLTLTNREFVLLRALIRNKNTAMTRDKLLEDAWGYDYFGETNVIDVYVRYIRHKTSDDVIRTIRGVGYMMADN